MSKKFNKSDFIKIVDSFIDNEEQAEKIVTTMFDDAAQELCSGNTVSLPGIGSLNPIIVPTKQMPVAGKLTQVREHLNIKIKVSSVIKKTYQQTYSSWAKLQKAFKK